MRREPTQEQKILKHLRRGKLTTIQSYDLYNITRPAAHINTLRKKGHKILSIPRTTGSGLSKKWWVEYKLVK